MDTQILTPSKPPSTQNRLEESGLISNVKIYGREDNLVNQNPNSKSQQELIKNPVLNITTMASGKKIVWQIEVQKDQAFTTKTFEGQTQFVIVSIRWDGREWNQIFYQTPRTDSEFPLTWFPCELTNTTGLICTANYCNNLFQAKLEADNKDPIIKKLIQKYNRSGSLDLVISTGNIFGKISEALEKERINSTKILSQQQGYDTARQLT